MSSRALTLALRLLTTAAAGVALGSMPGCLYLFGCGSDTGWQPQQSRDLGVEADLEAIIQIAAYTDEVYYDYLAVGTGGTVVIWGASDLASFDVGDADLHAAAAVGFDWWVVGDGGTVVSSTDSGQTWVPAELGTTANLHGIAEFNFTVVVVGDEVVFVRDSGGVWTEALAPAGGWGQLRGVYSDGERLYAFGRAGVVWSTDDPTGTWVAEDLSVDTDLLDAGPIQAGADGGARFAIIGAAGTLVTHEPDGTWTVVDTGVTADLIDFSESTLISAEGVVYNVEPDGTLISFETFAGMRALFSPYYDQIQTVGEGGMSISKHNYECIGGRPFGVEGELRTASLCAGDAWCGDAPADSWLVGELAQTLAAAWAQDGLYEHASVASFARFALELLALGAPPRLLREAQVAIQDELHHAQLCFGLARRFGGAPVGPGMLEIPGAALARVGDPAATALALFEEGCLNESVAACEAADALECCVDPQVREALEIIAADERRHAAAAWGALRWLLDRYGEQVRAPLRRRVAGLGVPRASARADVASSVELAAYGRLSARRRAAVQRRVISELVLPLAHAMLADPDVATTGC